MYDPILEALRRGATADALTAAETLVAERPDDAQALRWLSAAQLQSGQADAALASIDRAIALSPENAELHLARAGVLVGSRRPDEAQAALDQATGLDPNQFTAYVVQAQLALNRGDLEEAQRLNRLASRVAPEHPRLAFVDGMALLHRGDAEGALKTLSAALQRAPDDIQLMHALGFVYMARGHLAFAEQTFRNIAVKVPAATDVTLLIASLAGRQGRPDEALELLAPVLADAQRATVGVRSLAGRLYLQAGQLDTAAPLLQGALAAGAQDREVLSSLLEVWHRQGRRDDGRQALDACLAFSPGSTDLWLARLALEDVGSPGALAATQRWLDAAPDAVGALEARLAALEHVGRLDDAEAVADRIIALQPGHGVAQARKVNALVARDPAAAVAHVEALLAQAQSDDSRTMLLGWLGMAQDRAGQASAAVASWSDRARAQQAQSLPLPLLAPAAQGWPALATVPEGNAEWPLLLWGAPGSSVERMVAVFAQARASLLTDRFDASPPKDMFQPFATVEQLLSGQADASSMLAGWRASLSSRGARNGNVIDWLVWWDNTLLQALRPHLPQGRLLAILRDPRDMLLEWLAWGAPSMLAIPSVDVAATWLAGVLEHLAELLEQELYPAVAIRIDGMENDPQRLAEALGHALGGAQLPAPSLAGHSGFPSGHWRQYADALAGPFAMLTPVAVRLGYPEA
ncbi:MULTISPECIES: tetratricopeptide repeat protein [unclassified Pseudoxanthomonas]|uniref:tetratricopeptide repeat protein n=1 Tax=unclassified Pseudoxanthomonas TaxID=2645906 RepID=UPI0008EBE27C|nr:MULTISPECIES: tetratricopeptide repeat protein [unclassified Pseudoxanthomonas]PPJ41012.1 adenylate cyclase [Pseudoxanthomonas sp. KAs_5_3]SFV31504.1 Tfp pilus assembly protein PilF [Pseudoxanthomonas sp. YR558]